MSLALQSVTQSLQATSFKTYDELLDYLNNAPNGSNLELDVTDPYYEKLGPVLVKCFDDVQILGSTAHYMHFRPPQSFIVLLLLQHVYNA